MKKIFIILGLVIAAVFVWGTLLSTILELVMSLPAILLYVAYFIALGIVYEIFARLYKLFVKKKGQLK